MPPTASRAPTQVELRAHSCWNPASSMSLAASDDGRGAAASAISDLELRCGGGVVGRGDHAGWRVQVRDRRCVLDPVVVRVGEDHRDVPEILERRWRGDLPFQAAGLPRVPDLALAHDHRGPDEVDDEDEDRAAQDEGRYRDPVIQRLQVLRVLEYPARLAEGPGREERQERRVEGDEHDPELDYAEGPVQPYSHELRQPVVASAHEREYQPAHDGVVEVRHHEERTMHQDVGRHVRLEYPGHTADQEVEEER